MPVNLKGKHFLTLLDFTAQEVRYLLDLAHDFKSQKRSGTAHKHLHGKNIVLLFEKNSTRTRCAFEVAGHDLGMTVTFLDAASSQMGKKESIADTACVLGRMYDGIEYRGYGQSIVQELAEKAKVPVWNGLTDEFHPTQALADLLTMEEHFGQLKGLRVTYMGDACNNVANSLMIGCAKVGAHFTACGPEERRPNESLVLQCEAIAKEQGGSITVCTDVAEGAKNADVLYTDVWVSMGESTEVWESRIRLLQDYQINANIMKQASKEAIFLHCLPAFHDRNTSVGEDIFQKFGLAEMEVSHEVFVSKQSKVFDQAENRMHTIKAVMFASLS